MTLEDIYSQMLLRLNSALFHPKQSLDTGAVGALTSLLA